MNLCSNTCKSNYLSGSFTVLRTRSLGSLSARCVCVCVCSPPVGHADVLHRWLHAVRPLRSGVHCVPERPCNKWAASRCSRVAVNSVLGLHLWPICYREHDSSGYRQTRAFTEWPKWNSHYGPQEGTSLGGCKSLLIWQLGCPALLVSLTCCHMFICQCCCFKTRSYKDPGRSRWKRLFSWMIL